MCFSFLIFVLSLQRSTLALSSLIRIGTRPSPLAMKQAQSVAGAIQLQFPDIDTESVIIESLSEFKPATSPIQETTLAQTFNIDFTSVIDTAILEQQVDIGVHSLKDIPPLHKWIGKNYLTIAGFLPRATPVDVLITKGTPNEEPQSIGTLPPNARVGSASSRRQSQILSMRSDLQLINLRGNVQKRLESLEQGLVDALVMARAGLERMNLIHNNNNNLHITTLSTDCILPAPGQGIVGIVSRKSDEETLRMLDAISDKHASIAAAAELAVLDYVDAHLPNKPFSGRPPLAAFYVFNGKDYVLRARLLRPDGTRVVEVKRRHDQQDGTSEEEARMMGEDVGKEVVERAGIDFFKEL